MKPTLPLTPPVAHRDFFGTKLEIGDIVLGAKSKKSHYQDTSYAFSVIISKTKGMVRLHQLGDERTWLKSSSDSVLDSVSGRQGKRGGAIMSSNLISTGVNTGITEQEFNTVNTPTTAPSVPVASLFFP